MQYFISTTIKKSFTFQNEKKDIELQSFVIQLKAKKFLIKCYILT